LGLRKFPAPFCVPLGQLPLPVSEKLVDPIIVGTV
jgi:hypothetical protein